LNAPRILRRSLMRPGGRPIKRNQNLVVNCLNEKGTALVFYTGGAGRARRDALVEAGSHRHPHGEIRYHMELMALLGEAVMGQCAATERQVQEMLPIDELLQLLLHATVVLPLELRAHYLQILQEAYANCPLPLMAPNGL
jgi:hypothetical protein